MKVLTWTHTVVATLLGYDGVQYQLECPDPDNCPEEIYTERDWPDADNCRCEEFECSCRDGDHEDCSEYGSWVPSLGPICRLQRVEGCGLQEWFDNVGSDILSSWDGPEIRVKVRVYWEDEGPMIVRAIPEEK